MILYKLTILLTSKWNMDIFNRFRLCIKKNHSGSSGTDDHISLIDQEETSYTENEGITWTPKGARTCMPTG